MFEDEVKEILEWVEQLEIDFNSAESTFSNLKNFIHNKRDTSDFGRNNELVLSGKNQQILDRHLSKITPEYFWVSEALKREFNLFKRNGSNPSIPLENIVAHDINGQLWCCSKNTTRRVFTNVWSLIASVNLICGISLNNVSYDRFDGGEIEEIRMRQYIFGKDVPELQRNFRHKTG
jgi:hypothetical protein